MANSGGVYTFSQTAANNATADATQNWAEGMPPSAVNDSARAGMASMAKYRDDISGAILTTGTSTAYIVNSNQVFDTLADFHLKTIAFRPHVTNGATVTVTVDGFANLPLRSAPGVELLAGILIADTPYEAIYNNTDGALYLKSFYGTALPANSVTTSAIAAAAVTYAKIQNVAASKLLGNPTGAAAAPSEISLGAGLSFIGSALAASAPSLSGAVGLVITNNGTTPNSKIDVLADQVIMLSAAGLAIFATIVSFTIDTNTVGVANGLDTGSRAANSLYNIFIISDGTNTRGLASLSTTAPVLPSGFTALFRAGAMLTDGSGNFIKSKQVGNRTQYQASRAMSTVSSPTLTAVSVSSFVPPTATRIQLGMNDNSPGQLAVIAPNNTAYSGILLSPLPPLYSGGTSTQNVFAYGDIVLESTNIFAAIASGILTPWCYGWVDKVNAS